MKIQSIKILATSLVFFSLFFTTGCKKNKNTKKDKQSSFLKKSKSKKSSNVDAFDLDSDSMKSFAIDDKISKHAKLNNSSDSSSPLFSWEDQIAEETKKLFQTIYFDFNKDFLNTTESAKLEQNINQAKKMIKQGKTIVIEGHACHSAGSRAYNMALSERRARNVAQRFAEEGIDSSAIKIAPRGQEMPVRKGGSKKEQWVNRRVETYGIDSK